MAGHCEPKSCSQIARKSSALRGWLSSGGRGAGCGAPRWAPAIRDLNRPGAILGIGLLRGHALTRAIIWRLKVHAGKVIEPSRGIMPAKRAVGRGEVLFVRQGCRRGFRQVEWRALLFGLLPISLPTALRQKVMSKHRDDQKRRAAERLPAREDAAPGEELSGIRRKRLKVGR